ncbi:alpha-N-acetylgalactosaminide alpha-2,6-sialyltransferase 3-like [Ptychodera flava]|uniref:alpha-N-acetylgalactosaminide alpha-2,6-sialyltransferase 3-like n=1 Tax=Ptychodera flava TaxID=63121 RepID=UPI00396A6611
MKRKAIIIGILVIVQAAVLLYYVKFYGQDSSTEYHNRSFRLTVNGRQVYCYPNDNSTSASTFSLFCGERFEDVSKKIDHSDLNTKSPSMNGEAVENQRREDGEDHNVRETTVNATLPTKSKDTTDFIDRNADSILRGFPDEYLHVKSSEKKLDFHCDVCAIVSTSGQMLGSGAGAEIDNSSCVIRMNAAPVRGYEKDVGSRTTLRMMSFVTLQSKALIKRDILKLESHPEKIVLWSSYNPKVFPNVLRSFINFSSFYPDIQFYYTSKKQIEFIDSLFERETGKSRGKSGSWLSTGWFTLTFALHACDEIHIYGLVDSDHCDRNNAPKVDVPYHYYDPNGSKECTVYNAGEERKKGAHRYMTEKYIFKKWAKSANIYFHHPSWNISKDSNVEPLFIKSPANRYGSVHSPVKRRLPVRSVKKG